jgi:hypothetical protein
MAKQSRKTRKKDPQEAARRNLVRAQLKMQLAQEELTLANERGMTYVEQARRKAATWLTKASRKVERQARTLTKIEEELRGLSLSASVIVAVPLVAPAYSDIATTAREAVDGGERRADSYNLLERDLNALKALRSIDTPDGVTPVEWRAAAGLSETTLTRSREVLMQYGLVQRFGPPGRGARYGLTNSGRAFEP